MVRNLQELYQYRALLMSLVQRELKARYRASALGFLWTFLNPTLLMLVYALVFSVYLRQQVENYTYFMFVGLLPWIWFASSVTQGSNSISDRRDLLTKVRFPAQVLPATVVTSNLCNYLLSIPLMVALGLFFGVTPTWHLLLLPFIISVQLVFTLGIVYLMSALNVTFRDLQHVVANLITLWFFLTPVLYPASTVPERYRGLAVIANPMVGLITSYQAILYEHRLPSPVPLLWVVTVSVALLWISAGVFERRREEFAELV